MKLFAQLTRPKMVLSKTFTHFEIPHWFLNLPTTPERDPRERLGLVYDRDALESSFVDENVVKNISLHTGLKYTP